MLLEDTQWATIFASHAGQHRSVEVEPPRQMGATLRALGRSLATFQIGESGTGEHLFDAAHNAGASDDYSRALRSFVAEEQEHARLLALVLGAMDHPLLTKHWTDKVFIFLRRRSSLRTEVLTLLVAELIALTYYAAMRDGEPHFSHVFGRIHADEIRHIDFHAQTLPEFLAAWNPVVRSGVRFLWNVLVAGTSVLIAIDHRSALNHVGVGPVRFVRSVWRDLRALDCRLFVESRNG